MNTKGFTIVESLVAISILVLAVTGAFGAAQSGLASSSHSKNQIIAFYLAQEGMEQIRNMRDENGLTGRNWLAGIAQNASDPCYFGKVCRVDAVNSTVSACPGGEGSCPVLRQDDATGFYGYTASWDPTIFKREISLVSINDHEVSILVSIEWTRGLITREFRARENILNWQ